MILFVTTNKDTFNNPLLFSIFSILESKRIRSLLVVHGESFFNNNFRHCILIKTSQTNFDTSSANNIRHLKNHIYNLFLWNWYRKKVKRIIAIDSEGLILASFIKKSRYSDIPLDYLSFEIRFKNEYHRKQKEIECTKQISRLIIQDEMRGNILRNENEISESIPTCYIPVSFARVCHLQESIVQKIDIRKNFKLSKDAKLIVFFGTFDIWTGSDYVIDFFEYNTLPQDFYLVIHSRYGFNNEIDQHQKIVELAKRNDRIILNDCYIEGFSESVHFLKQFDIGVNLYKPNDLNACQGENIYNIGLSSGKFSMYMMAGLPVIMSKLPTYEELNEDYEIGFCIDGYFEFEKLLKNIGHFDLNAKKQNCLKLYRDKLDISKSLFNYLDINYHEKI
jgi:glycosyltransferase involved in cell wall biosynthesis